MTSTFFKTPSEWRRWLERHGGRETELWVGFYKKSTGRPSITYQEALDEALCYGWIDGVRYRVDDASYTIRFTPRKPRSNWSAVNVRRVRELAELGRMQPAGLEAFDGRDQDKIDKYSYERANVKLAPQYEKQLRANARAWEFFRSKPPSYRKPVVWWIMSAKKEETRQKRLETLIRDSARGRTVGPMTRPE